MGGIRIRRLIIGEFWFVFWGDSLPGHKKKGKKKETHMETDAEIFEREYELTYRVRWAIIDGTALNQ